MSSVCVHVCVCVCVCVSVCVCERVCPVCPVQKKKNSYLCPLLDLLDGRHRSCSHHRSLHSHSRLEIWKHNKMSLSCSEQQCDKTVLLKVNVSVVRDETIKSHWELLQEFLEELRVVGSDQQQTAPECILCTVECTRYIFDLPAYRQATHTHHIFFLRAGSVVVGDSFLGSTLCLHQEPSSAPAKGIHYHTPDRSAVVLLPRWVGMFEECSSLSFDEFVICKQTRSSWGLEWLETISFG